MRTIVWKGLWLAALLSVGSLAPVQAEEARTDGYTVVKTYPHDPRAFTQGLLWRDGFLYESTGLHGRSSVRKVTLETGVPEQERLIDSRHFGEGLVDWKDRLINLTWQDQMGFIFDINSFERVGEFSYPGEGWGLTRDQTRIIMSDGTSALRFLDPETLKETGRIQVTDDGKPVDNLNELEWVKGEVLANIWQTDRIARIDPATGKVKGWIDLTGLLSVADQAGGHVDVLNGIAYDAATDRLFVTGKLWPKLFEIRLRPNTN
ncbi:glutaminyl-peptide cyclotransferase [Caulobacter henricii]|uniref:Glutamine cyclotransferase n=1 Tax=Caulobacter henricii TaxID=69395 RepID=A0A0P0NXY0_9CAUL|nr:glutaminyl-peptide cyclotransferase [Caulobacter henricii]ALL12629.1 glutamine cyclotransferase [Caulobacter henricii]